MGERQIMLSGRNLDPPVVRDRERELVLTGGVTVLTGMEVYGFVGALKSVFGHSDLIRRLPLVAKGKRRHRGVSVEITEAVDNGLAGSIIVTDGKVERMRSFALCRSNFEESRLLAARAVASEVEMSLHSCRDRGDVGLVVASFSDLLANDLDTFVIDKLGSGPVVILGRQIILEE